MKDKVPKYLQHVPLKDNVFTIDSHIDKLLIVEWLNLNKAKYTITQKTVSRCEINVKRFG